MKPFDMVNSERLVRRHGQSYVCGGCFFVSVSDSVSVPVSVCSHLSLCLCPCVSLTLCLRVRESACLHVWVSALLSSREDAGCTMSRNVGASNPLFSESTTRCNCAGSRRHEQGWLGLAGRGGEVGVRHLQSRATSERGQLPLAISEGDPPTRLLRASSASPHPFCVRKLRQLEVTKATSTGHLQRSEPGRGNLPYGQFSKAQSGKMGPAPARLELSKCVLSWA